MKTNNEYVQLGGVLLLITAVVALLLGFFNNLTKDTIADAKAQQKLESMQTVMKEASSFELMETELPEGSIAEVHQGFDKSGNSVGYCFTLLPRGYGGEITVMAGVSTSGAVTGAEIVSHSETPGLGANADNETWLAQFAGKTSGITVVKNPPQGNQIQAVTSATVTSRAVTGAINEALDFASSLIEAEKEAE